MPILQCRSKVLWERIGKFTEEGFTDLCFAFGIELDEVTSERKMYEKEAGAAVDKAVLMSKSDDELYKIDIPANRYDLLCMEGLTQALLVFMEKRQAPVYKLKPEKPTLKMTVDKSILPIRPYVVCAVLKGITFNETSLKSFIDLQEKLHHNIARKRTLVSVGTHDLSTITGPFTYEATPKEKIDFLPLAAGTRGNLKGPALAEYYKDDKHIGQYVPLISCFDSYPAIYDSAGTLMSLPPIINSDHSKISVDTKDVFIECTAKDYTKAKIVTNMIVTAFSEYSETPFTVEPVEVTYPEMVAHLPSQTVVTPDVSVRTFELKMDYINKTIGISITAAEAAGLLKKMMLSATPLDEGKALQVEVPVTRADILHECDIMEDVAIAYGYERLLSESVAPAASSTGKQHPREALRSIMRTELGLAGYTEMMTFSLCALDEATTKIGRAEDFYPGVGLVKIANSASKLEFQLCRPSLLPGTLKTLAYSKNQPLPLQLFEVTDVVLSDPEHRIGARNETRVCAARVSAKSAGFELIQGVFEHSMTRLGIKSRSATNADGWYIESGNDDGAFYPGWQMNIFCNGKQIGSMGVIHPEVLKSFDIPFPCSYMEYNLEPFISAA